MADPSRASAGERLRSSDYPNQPQTGELSWPWLLLIWLVAALVMTTHRPSTLLQPQFWAEDGRIWYAQAYQQGPVLPLTHTQDGYFQTLPRLIADAATPAPLPRAPLVMNLLALLLQGLPAVFLLSSRTASWGPLRHRAVLAVLYLTLPNSQEWHANTTNTQWVLALLALLVVLARPPRTWRGGAADVIVLLLSGLTGPFCILLAPVACAMAWLRRQRWRMLSAAIVLGSAGVQGWALILTRHTSRMHQPLGASAALLLRILAARIFSSAILGSFAPLASVSLPFVIPLVISLASLALVAAACWKGPLELRLFVLFSAEILTTALRTPMVTKDRPQWPEVLMIPGSRYYMFPMLAFLVCVAFLAAAAPRRWLRVAATILLCLTPLGMVRNWRDYSFGPQLKHYADFRADLARFEAAPTGTTVDLRVEPASTWHMILVKH